MSLRPSRLHAFTAFLVLALPLAGQEADLAERLFRSGERAYGARSHAEALETWNQLLQQSPASPFAAQALLRMARHFAEAEGKPEAALPLLDRVKAEHMSTPWAAEALLMRGRILASRAAKPAELREAVAEFHRLVDLFPDHPAVPEARLQLGLAAMRQGQWDRALPHFAEVLRLDPATPTAARAWLQMAECLDLKGDLEGCLRMLQGLRTSHPDRPEAAEAAWRLGLRVKHRLQRPPFRSQGPWPAGRQKWLKTPTLLAVGPTGGLFIYQSDLDRVFRLSGADLVPAGGAAKDARALVVGPDNQPWAITRTGVIREDGQAPLPLPEGASNPVGACRDAWGSLWVADGKAGTLTVLAPEGTPRSLPSPAAAALASLPSGGAVLASDANRSLLFLDGDGQTRFTIPYGQGLPKAFTSVVALCSDPAGHVAALVDGAFEGVVLWGPDGALLRHATLESLGLKGRFRAIALDREGGVILADRSNDLLIRLD